MFQPLWDWAVDLIMNPQLHLHFEWDAQQIFRHTGETTTCVYHEPWTGDAFWNVQVHNHHCSNLCLHRPYCVELDYCSLKSRWVHVPCVSFSMQIRQTCPLLAQQRAIQWLHAVQIYLPQSGMAMVLVVGVLLDGCQLYVPWQGMSPCSSVCSNF